MSDSSEYRFENYQEYVGGIEEVRRHIDDCKICGAKLLVSHLPDHKNLLIQETARCMECGEGSRKVIHIIN